MLLMLLYSLPLVSAGSNITITSCSTMCNRTSLHRLVIPLERELAGTLYTGTSLLIHASNVCVGGMQQCGRIR